jgi:hypothetical protein
MSYHLERKESSVWVSVGFYSSEASALNELASRSKSRRGMWRIVKKEGGTTSVIVTIVT